MNIFYIIGVIVVVIVVAGYLGVHLQGPVCKWFAAAWASTSSGHRCQSIRHCRRSGRSQRKEGDTARQAPHTAMILTFGNVIRRSSGWNSGSAPASNTARNGFSVELGAMPLPPSRAS